MSAKEKAADASVRDAIIEALFQSNLLPVLPLLEIITGYSLPFRGIVSCVGPGDPSDRSGNAVPLYSPVNVRAYVDPRTRETSFLVPDATGKTYKQVFADGTVRYGTARGRDTPCAGICAGRVVVLTGSDLVQGVTCGPALTHARFTFPSGICVDPLNANRFYLTDEWSVRVLERTNGADGGLVSLLAGGDDFGAADGIGSFAGFNHVTDLVCTSDGRTLFVCDSSNGRVRSIATQIGEVSTLAGSGHPLNCDGFGLNASLFFPKSLAFDAAATAKPESALYVTCTQAIIMRVEIQTRSARSIRLELPAAADPSKFVPKPLPSGVASLPSGLLLFTCSNTHSLYARHAAADGVGCVERIAGSGLWNGCGRTNGSALSESTFNWPSAICVLAAEQCVIVADTESKLIRRVTLPHYFFSPNTYTAAATQ